MVTVAMRNIIGTALLSVAIAQQILDSIINGKGKKEIAVAKIIRAQQKKAILKIASVIVAISVATSAATALTLIDWHRFKFSGDDNYLTSTITEYHYYNDDSVDETSSENNGGFWGNLFGGNTSSDSSDNSSDTSNSQNTYSTPSHSESISDNSSNSSQNSSSKTPSINGNTTVIPIQPDDTTPDDATQNDGVINVFGNNPNNVMTVNSDLEHYATGLVAKQGEWIYYVQQYGRIMKVKTDGSDAQMILEASGYSYIECLNVIGDTIYYINGGIWSVKTDGTDRKQHTTKAAHNLLVRGTTGWFVEITNSTQVSCDSRYSLYQIDFTTDTITTFVENGIGFGLKTVVDNKLIYVNGLKVYSRDLSTGHEEVIFNVSDYTQDAPSSIKFSIQCMFIDTDYNVFIETRATVTEYSYITYKFNLNQPNVVQETYDCFDRIYNCFDYNGIAFYAIKTGTLSFNFYDLQGNAMCEENEDIYRQAGVYTFDDGYAYYFDKNRTSLYRSYPDGTDMKIY